MENSVKSKISNLDTDIVNVKDVKYLMESHELFSIIYSKYGQPPNWTRPQGFVTLSRIILEQQVSLMSANAHFIKLNSYLGEFIPSEILKLSDLEMRNCQISRQKAKYLRELSFSILSNDINLENLPKLEVDEIRQKLMHIKGIGHWTTDIYLMFCLQAKDIFPLGDVAIINTIKELSEAQTREDIIQLSDKWKPYRSLATYFLWHYYLSKRNRTV